MFNLVILVCGAATMSEPTEDDCYAYVGLDQYVLETQLECELALLVELEYFYTLQQREEIPLDLFPASYNCINWGEAS